MTKGTTSLSSNDVLIYGFPDCLLSTESRVIMFDCETLTQGKILMGSLVDFLRHQFVVTHWQAVILIVRLPVNLRFY